MFFVSQNLLTSIFGSSLLSKDIEKNNNKDQRTRVEIEVTQITMHLIYLLTASV